MMRTRVMLCGDIGDSGAESKAAGAQISFPAFRRARIV